MYLEIFIDTVSAKCRIVIFGQILFYFDGDFGNIKNIVVHDMGSQIIYKFNDVNSLVKEESFQDSTDNSIFKRISTKIIDAESMLSISGFNVECEYEIQTNLKNSEFGKLKFLEFIAEINLIDKYISNEKYRAKIPWLGRSYAETSMYTLSSTEITHGSSISLFRVTGIDESMTLSKASQYVLDVVKKNIRN